MAGVTRPTGPPHPADVGDAYSQAGAAWATGPARVYDRLADVLVGTAPGPLGGQLVLDLGAGTGAASRAVLRAGGRALACDVALGMLCVGRADRPPAAVADARALPLADGSVDGVVAAFALNHLPDPEVALAEAARATTRGGFLLASAYAADDDHPVKAAVNTAAAEQGWTGAPWYEDLRRSAIPVLATTDGAARAARAAGLVRIDVSIAEVAFPELDARDLVAWRLGLAHLAPFIEAGGPARRRTVERRALDLLGTPPPLVRRVVLLRALL
jgi:SAM-dependent methyltransferase